MLTTQEPEVIALPTPFLHSMRILFDIMDDNQVGAVKFVDIERRWGKEPHSSSGLPKGILECLRNVTNSAGELTFDRFCAGLKICLLKNESGKCDPSAANGFPVIEKIAEPMPPPKPPRMSADKMFANSVLPNRETTSSPPSKRREPRRHTLQNGIDYNRLKRLKQLEQEKVLLKESLLRLNETQSWLNRKLHNVHDQIRLVGRSNAPLENSPNHQERLDMKQAQAAEVNRSLIRLVNNWSSIDKNDFLFELNLETTTHSHWTSHERGVQRLAQDNRRLLEELSLKQETINRLEMDKMNLMRQMKRY